MNEYFIRFYRKTIDIEKAVKLIPVRSTYVTGSSETESLKVLKEAPAQTLMSEANRFAGF